MPHKIIGIDLGRSKLNVAFIPENEEHPRDWKSVEKIDIREPDWWKKLLELIEEGAVVAAEPTGGHTLNGIAKVITHYKKGVEVWQVSHEVTGEVRRTRVSKTKNDRLDAIALALIAKDIESGKPPLGTRKIDIENADKLTALRMLVNQHVSLTKEKTRQTNRIRSLAAEISPRLATSDTYLQAAEKGFITLEEMRAALNSTEYSDGRKRRHLEKLIEELPNIPTPPIVPDMVLTRFGGG